MCTILVATIVATVEKPYAVLSKVRIRKCLTTNLFLGVLHPNEREISPHVSEAFHIQISICLTKDTNVCYLLVSYGISKSCVGYICAADFYLIPRCTAEHCILDTEDCMSIVTGRGALTDLRMGVAHQE